MTFYNHPILKTLQAGGIDGLIIKIKSRDQYLISLFDDDFYTQADFDIIDGKTRSMMTALFKKSGMKAKGSRHFIGLNGENFLLAKPSHTLGCNPADKVIEAFSPNSFIFCTPTQALLILLACEETLDNQFIKDFLYRQPVNVKKLLQWVEHDGLSWGSKPRERDLAEICEEGIKLRKSGKLEKLNLIEIS